MINKIINFLKHFDKGIKKIKSILYYELKLKLKKYQ